MGEIEGMEKGTRGQQEEYQLGVAYTI